MRFLILTDEQKEILLDAIRIRLGVDHLAEKHGRIDGEAIGRRYTLEHIAASLCGEDAILRGDNSEWRFEQGEDGYYRAVMKNE